ncbi:hypothetical protein B0T26DRAFT_339404 [Lasiosphaeria miniovina]|uniref:Uncharacterized protein n=1 Tax=Lasiosphaeria miniovina TaxID=1954250 RepID=A0AA40AAW0_9PEZI|nr:uncharacterized protein B0T26DRAFT_339404 [Lasiosphaeria miniovina]KAK0712530.1 hypothetical protein B0T26DRAFT_339404 [Lasiosphaeria miniovina]
MAPISSDIVPLNAGRIKRLYGPVRFQAGLTNMLVSQGSTTASDLDTTEGKSFQGIYFCFVNKLGQICDFKRGGDTVTAFAVLQPGSIEYHFTMNKASAGILQTVTTYVEGILETLNSTSDEVVMTADQNSPIFIDIRRRVIRFNRPRIRWYIKQISKYVGLCINSSDADGTSDGASVSRHLRVLQQLSAFVQQTEENLDFVDHGQKLLEALRERYRPLDRYMRSKLSVSEDDTAISDSPWVKLRHPIGRLQSYNVAVKVLISVRHQLPRLFSQFSVVAVPPAAETEAPNINVQANTIIGKMTNDKAKIESHRLNAEKLQAMGLDRNIKEANEKVTKLKVHAEVNLLDSILRDSREEPVPFYNEGRFGRYIGCSKPTCQLCHLYFGAHPARVTVRTTHHNLYPGWRTPDVYVSDGPAAAARRDKIVEQMILGIRQVTFDSIQTMAAPWRHSDSGDTATNPFVSTLSTAGSVVRTATRMSQAATPVPGRGRIDEHEDDDVFDDLASKMGQLDVQSVRDLSSESEEEGDSIDRDEDEDEDEDEGWDEVTQGTGSHEEDESDPTSDDEEGGSGL